MSAPFASTPLLGRKISTSSAAHLLAGKYETAAALLRERILLVPGTDFSRVLLASSLGYLGEVDEAGRIWRELSARPPTSRGGFSGSESSNPPAAARFPNIPTYYDLLPWINESILDVPPAVSRAFSAGLRVTLRASTIRRVTSSWTSKMSAVPDANFDVAVPLPLQPLNRPLPQLIDDFDAVYFAGQLGEHCSLVTKAGANFEDNVVGLELKQVRHHRNKEINPKYSFREHFSRQPFRPGDVERVAEGLAKAGLPT